ncbi:serine/threonine-protein kinase haspin homolog isoform X12 [Drosophila suzukii]|uniref:Serine/threonine-protein kinase haspin homolog isoform X12 n=1 Tax=Drosophila suzukii TaxID=28584 RepID=A0ABM4TZ08_DROSZ
MDKSSGDEIWEDSFDKLLDPRPQQSNLNIIKKNVRLSYNIDTSVENSSHSIKGKDLFNCGLSPINRLQLDGFEDTTEKCNADKDAEPNTKKRGINSKRKIPTTFCKALETI